MLLLEGRRGELRLLLLLVDGGIRDANLVAAPDRIARRLVLETSLLRWHPSYRPSLLSVGEGVELCGVDERLVLLLLLCLCKGCIAHDRVRVCEPRLRRRDVELLRLAGELLLLLVLLRRGVRVVRVGEVMREVVLVHQAIKVEDWTGFGTDRCSARARKRA